MVVGGILSGLLVLWLTRRYDFFLDEWSYVLYVRDFSIGQYFVPHNEHWVTVPLLTYRVLLLIFGARTYQPYMAVLAIWTLLTALFLFLLIRRRSGDVPGLAAAAIFLVFGRGFGDLLWADQMGFMGAAALGLLAILLLTGSRVPMWRGWAGSVALMASLMSSGPALFFLCWLFVEIVFEQRAWRRLGYLVLPVAAYLVWFGVIGRTGMAHDSPLSPSTLESLPAFVASGIGATAVAVVGLGPSWAPIGGIVFAAIVGAAWWRRGRAAWAMIAAAAGLVAEFVLIGVVRVGIDPTIPRYIDIAVIFVLVILADAVSHVRWRSPAAGAALAVVLIGLLVNGLYLHEAAGARYSGEILPSEVSEQVAWAYRDSPGLNQSLPVDPTWLPVFPVRDYVASRKAQGSVLPNLSAQQLSRYPASLLDRSMLQDFPPTVSVTASLRGMVCSPEPTEGVQVAAGATVVFRSNEPGPMTVQVWHYGPPTTTATAQATLARPDQALAVRTGAPRVGFEWSVRAEGAPGSVVSVCTPP